MKCTDCHNAASEPFCPHLADAVRARNWSISDWAMKNPAYDVTPTNAGHSSLQNMPVCASMAVKPVTYPTGRPMPKLLRRPVVFTLCLECHNGAGSFGRSNNGLPPFQGSNH